jgi:formate hydrogenlyase subunit 3/multisubunit Na+/H+ antiporter MnhD subunit
MNELALMVAVPLSAAFLLPIIDRLSGHLARLAGPLALAVSGGIGLLAWSQLGDSTYSLELGGFRPPLGIVFYVDRLSLLFALSVTIGVLLLWPASGENRLRKSVLALILAAAGTGLSLSGDLFNLYVFYELMAVASYGLAAASGSAAAHAATLRYLIISALGAALALAGIALVYQATGTLNLAQLAQLAPERLTGPQGLAAFALLLIGFGVKAELFPVNTWVPEVYATTSSRVCALLAGITSKLALLIFIRLLVLVFHQPEALQLMLVLGMLGIVTGELSAWRARDMNRMLAYSSIGQLGLIFIAFSVPGPAGLFAGLAVALHHLLVKPALFLLAERWGGSLARLEGAAAKAPVAAALFALLALSLVGVPPLPGFWAKLLVLIQLLQQGGSMQSLAVAVILTGAALEVNYLFRVVASLYRKPLDTGKLPEAHSYYGLGVAATLGVALLAATVLVAPLGNALSLVAGQAADSDHYIATVNPEATP